MIDWIKLTTTMFDDDKIEFIETLPDADTILIIWIKLLTLAGKCNAGGFIMLTEKIPYTAETLSNKFRRPLNTVKLALQTFKELDMIEQEPEKNGAFYLLNWTKHQNIETMDRIREQTKERQQKFRDRKKLCALVENSDISTNTASRDTNVMRNVTNNVTLRIENKNRDIENKDLNTIVEIDESENEFSGDNEIFDQIPESIIDDMSINEPVNNTTCNQQPVTNKCPLVPFDQIMHEFNTRCPKQPRIRDIKGSRQKHIKACWKENPSLDYFINLFDEVNISDFLNGGSANAWIAGFDWIINHTNRRKVLEGNYKNRPKPVKPLPDGRAPNYANFDQREYDEKEIEQFYITASNRRR